ncbi:MAG: D-alanyl-D-alanine carboxypeptidase [Cellulophaga sp.]|nr:D-alanyl-D-alanine carboxypeptidase [Cellulophaga sp.]
MKKYIYILLIISGLTSCSPTKHQLKKQTTQVLKDTIFKNQFLGVLIYDPIKKDTLISLNSDKYFLPASNTKIFTLYTALQTLPEKIPALKYVSINDTLYIKGTGDPTFMHSYFKDSTTISFLRKYKNINLYLDNFESERYGPGWAWDDYEYYYQPERSSFPIYGNVATISKKESLQVHPDFFRNEVIELVHHKRREMYRNTFYYNPGSNDTIETPFMVDKVLIKTLLESALDKKIKLSDSFPIGEIKTLYSVSSDSVYKRMMDVSDNFLAEQLLVLSSATLSDTLSVEKAQENILKNQLSDLNEMPRWVDGSGLSRYNLFSPKSFIQILEKLYKDQPKERLFNLFPMKGRFEAAADSIENGTPYIYAKSGSFGNNYSLSGYLLTKSGKVLIFSFMNNHYREATTDLQKRMYAIFENLRDHY